jgi:hypothetical protein
VARRLRRVQSIGHWPTFGAVGEHHSAFVEVTQISSAPWVSILSDPASVTTTTPTSFPLGDLIGTKSVTGLKIRPELNGRALDVLDRVVGQSRQGRDRIWRSHSSKRSVRERKVARVATGRKDLDEVSLGARRSALAQRPDRFPSNLPGTMVDERAEDLGVPFLSHALHEFGPGQPDLDAHRPILA